MQNTPGKSNDMRCRRALKSLLRNTPSFGLANRARRWKGHLWQGRFFFSLLDDQYPFSLGASTFKRLKS
jgi:hypothetical protein